jgi:hypothetical protein
VPRVARIHIGKYHWELPRSRILRVAIGVILVIFGLFGFLPVVGFWMIPLGLLVLANDIPAVRRLNRRVAVAVKRWWARAKRKARSNTA